MTKFAIHIINAHKINTFHNFSTFKLYTIYQNIAENKTTNFTRTNSIKCEAIQSNGFKIKTTQKHTYHKHSGTNQFLRNNIEMQIVLDFFY